jgi:selenocysteine-specific translation elongation factor
MPIPKKEKNEDKQKFVQRCMSNETMKTEYPDSSQRVAICLGQTRQKGKSDLIEEVHDELFAKNCSWDDEWDEFVWEIEAPEIYDEDDKLLAAEKGGRKVTLNKPFRTPDGPKKFSVYVKNDRGNVVKVNFGDPNMKIKKNIPERRRSFRARHNCDSPGPKWKARYWSCKAW